MQIKPTRPRKPIRPKSLTLSRTALAVAAALALQTAQGADTGKASTDAPGQTGSQTTAVTLEKVLVEESAIPEDSGQSGFRPGSAEIGPFKRRALQDTPYSITVVDSRLIENQQVNSLPELLKYLPSAQMEARGGPEVGRAQTRGMQSDPVANNHLDGMNVVGTTAQPVEMMERLEVINGLTGAFYGPASPAGNFNFIQKRPTGDFLNRLTLGYSHRAAGLVHGDFGGHIGRENPVGYRVNLLKEKGEGYVPHSDINRELASAAIDVHLGANTVLELNGSYYQFEKFGFPGGFSYASSIELPDAPDPARAGYGQSFAGMSLDTTTTSARIKHDFNDRWSVTAGILQQDADRWVATVSNTLTDNLGNYSSRVSSSAPNRFAVTSNTATLNGRFETGGIGHEVVVGTTGFDWDIEVARSPAIAHTLGSANIDDPVRFPRVPLSKAGSRRLSSNNWQQSAIIGDAITFNEQWSAMIVGSYSWIEVENFSPTGAVTGGYEDEGFSPTAALMFKPVGNITTYVAYADSLQRGDTAPATGVSNPGEALAPYRSEQLEAGVKAKLSGFDVNVAVFRIERPFAFTDPADGLFKELGLQVNKGLELGINGEVFSGLNLYGGVTLLDPRLEDTQDRAKSGKYVVGTPKVQANLLLEYHLSTVPGLSFSTNIHHTGKRAINNLNTGWTEAYTTVDLGLRYTTQAFVRKTTFRLGVLNAFDEHYWISIFPGDINGGTAANTAFSGMPREVRLSASVEF